MRILVVNAGTSSVKLSVVEGADSTVAEEELPAPGDSTAAAVLDFLGGAGAVDAVGHRVVHGGSVFRDAVVVDDRVRGALDGVVELAPLHMPPALRLLDALRDRLPSVPNVACFDTGFHATLPPAAYTYAVPERWRSLGVRRYGFHGLSCAWSLRRAAGLLGRAAEALQLVVAHLGSGASVTAIRQGGSADTSMGLTPLEGLVMARRSGSIDPGALTWLQSARGIGVDDLYMGLESQSGVYGLAGTDDMREVVRRAAADDPAASRALDTYLHRARAQIAAMAASLDRLDALVFTGGVGENAATIRDSICAGLPLLGLPGTLAAPSGSADAVISEEAASPAVMVVHAREDLEVAREVQLVLQRG
jgi:acetate kinase